MKSDLVDVILDLMAGKKTSIEWHDKFYVGVVLASKGYPEGYEKGAEIKGLENCQSLVFHAGTAKKEGKWITQGGRVLMVVGEGETQAEATQNAYNSIHNIDCNNLFYRKDIGYQSL
jgi:phosphoribosylamine--glycine ligase